jgi:prepilin-type N-terminal cleavage/methylation domain-containing protein
MKPRFSNQRNHALTLIEVLVVIAVLAVLVAMLLPTGPHVGQKAIRINCVNNLKEIGLAYKLWAGDHNDKLPMEVSVTNGGTMELVADGKNAWLNFLVMSNELSTPKILYCYADEDHVYAAKFSSDLQSNVSYFVGLNATTNYPQSILSGDDNFEISGVPVKPSLLEISTNASISWSAARHKFVGNIGLADGSVQMVNNSGLTNLLQQTGLATDRLAIP